MKEGAVVAADNVSSKHVRDLSWLGIKKFLLLLLLLLLIYIVEDGMPE